MSIRFEKEVPTSVDPHEAVVFEVDGSPAIVYGSKTELPTAHDLNSPMDRHKKLSGDEASDTEIVEVEGSFMPDDSLPIGDEADVLLVGPPRQARIEALKLARDLVEEAHKNNRQVPGEVSGFYNSPVVQATIQSGEQDVS